MRTWVKWFLVWWSVVWCPQDCGGLHLVIIEVVPAGGGADEKGVVVLFGVWMGQQKRCGAQGCSSVISVHEIFYCEVLTFSPSFSFVCWEGAEELVDQHGHQFTFAVTMSVSASWMVLPLKVYWKSCGFQWWCQKCSLICLESLCF